MAGEDRYSAGANPPFLAQMCHCPVVVWGLPALVAPQRTANFLPSRGGKPSAVFGLMGVAVLFGGFYPHRAGVPLLGRRTGESRTTRCALARPPKKLFSPFHTYIEGGQLLAGVMLPE